MLILEARGPFFCVLRILSEFRRQEDTTAKRLNSVSAACEIWNWGINQLKTGHTHQWLCPRWRCIIVYWWCCLVNPGFWKQWWKLTSNRSFSESNSFVYHVAGHLLSEFRVSWSVCQYVGHSIGRSVICSDRRFRCLFEFVVWWDGRALFVHLSLFQLIV